MDFLNYIKQVNGTNLYMTLGVFIGIIVIIVIFKSMKTKKVEKLENVENDTVTSSEPSIADTNVVQEDIPIKPTFFDAGSGSIMSGPEFIPSQYLSPWYQAYTGNLKNYYLLDDGEGGSAGLQFNKCSKSCCSEQYPLPFKMPVDSDVCADKAEYVPNNYMCNNAWNDTGCVCMTKKQANFIGSRGGNA